MGFVGIELDERIGRLLRDVDQMPKDVRKGVRDELRAVAVPARDEAQRLFLGRVAPDRRKTRYGISVRRSGVVSVEQRRRSKDRSPKRRRPVFTTLQWERVLNPVAEDVAAAMPAAFGNVLDTLERRWRGV